MEEGRILAASQDGAYVVRLTGDVRLTLCTTIDDYLQRMLNSPDFASVWVDLCDAEGIDSTTLGLLAKLALEVRARYGFMPAIYSSNPGITRLIKSMGFQRLFDVHEDACANPECIDCIPLVEGSEAAVRDKVIEAHRVLMGLSEENRARFKDLMVVLERS
ncbi:MAG: anti-anti-sigma factor [Haliea sp.]|mgnify:FL=1|jgi:anti-anti-sigma factor|uniref:STAS domain-containing protein n=1 Tax=Haliea sp. TaxID=1932666 RepID=UPI000C48738F|nr:STAS domain-containing protein [Haliea sp.]MBM68333.1 anti-anti-sigma factor [Haliea sp.]|tara:strand:- start:113456 stop:113938 length:483 start_codon:yes stop_codon:yes gene_type:complete